MNHQAIYETHPSVVLIKEEEDGIKCFDTDSNLVVIDETLVNAWVDPNAWKDSRISAYPPATDYLDGIVKNDQVQIDKYIADCLAVKAQYPKGDS